MVRTNISRYFKTLHTFISFKGTVDSLTKLPIGFPEVFASFVDIKAVVMENNVNLEGHAQFEDFIEKEEVFFKIKQGIIPIKCVKLNWDVHLAQFSNDIDIEGPKTREQGHAGRESDCAWLPSGSQPEVPVVS